MKQRFIQISIAALILIILPSQNQAPQQNIWPVSLSNEGWTVVKQVIRQSNAPYQAVQSVLTEIDRQLADTTKKK